MPLPSDISTRQQALDTSQSFAVSAPAGSGKTGLLTQRMLALLAKCEQPENILAITFTKKAAAEMQNRILSALLHVQRQLKQNCTPPTNEHELTTWKLAKAVLERDHQQQWQLLSLPNRLRITTIDGFCRMLSQHMPLNNGMGNIPDMLESTESDHAYLLAARETLALLEKKTALQNDLFRITQHFNNQLSTIETLFINLLKRRDQWLGSLYIAKDQRKLLESSLKFVIEEHLQTLQQHLQPFAGELIELADYAARCLDKENSDSLICSCLGIAELPKNNHNELKQWHALAEIVLTQAGLPRKRVNKAQGFPPADKKSSKEQQDFAKQQKQKIEYLLVELSQEPELCRLLHQTRQLPKPSYSDTQWQLLDSLTRVLTQLVANLYVVFQQLGKTDFIQITQAALTALGTEEEPSDLALILDYKIQHILVDEFQDTSTPQLQLIKRLTTGWQENDGRTLFVVGDAMQSCYSFRDANVGIFLDVRQYGIGDIKLTPLDLTVNFRSQQKLVEWCNRVFDDVFPKENSINESAVKYQPAVAFNPALENEAVTTHLFISEEKIKQRQHEAQKIVDIIYQQQQKEPSNSVAVLVRKRTQVGEITQALNQANIDYNAIELDKLNHSMVVQDLLSLTRALLYPHDHIAWLAILRAPWCGIDMHDLYEIANTEIKSKRPTILSLLTDYTDSINLSSAGREILQRFTASVKMIVAQQGRYNLRTWIESAWVQLGGHALLLTTEEKNAANTFFNALEQQQQAGKIPNWQLFSQSIDQLYNINTTKPSEKKQQASQIPPVEVMTIHKSKGLEFDSVIIPGLDLTSTSDKPELLVWLEWLDIQLQSRLLISPIHATGDDKDPIYDFIRQKQKYKQQLEAERLFYVGCTRAINQLFLLGYSQIKNEKTTQLSSPPENTALAYIWPHVQENITTHRIEGNESDSSQVNDLLQHPNYIIRFSTQWQRPIYTPNNLLSRYRLQNAYEKIEPDNRASPDKLMQRHPRYFGQVLHSVLQQLVETGFSQWTPKRIKQQQTFWQQHLQQLGLTYATAKQQAQKISSIIEKLLTSKTAAWLFSNQHLNSQCELSLWTTVKDQSKELIIDRTFIDKDSKHRWIIDYKSSEPVMGQPIDEFIEEETNLYKPQLDRYKKLFQGQPHPIRCALYFPQLDKLSEIID